MPDERKNIHLALSERRNAERVYRQAVIQIPAERPLLHHLFKVAVRSGDDTHIDGNGARIAHTLDDLAIQYPEELYLRRQRQLADFVEKEGSPVGTLEIAAPPGLRPGERPFFIAEKFALQQCGSDGAAIHPHKRPPAPARKLMDGLRNKLFAGAGFPGHEYGGPCGGDFLDTLPQGGQPRALPYPLVAREPFLNLPHCDRDIRKGGGKLLRKRGDEAA